MKIFLGIIQTILILIFLLLGGQKVFMPLPELINAGMLWIEDFPEWQVRVIAILEVLGAFGLFLPYIIKALPKILIPAAAAGLALTMVGAVITHIMRGDPSLSIIVTSILTLFGVVVAVLRYKQYKS